jgi:TRAP-type C4-dicarboxylate transport system permease small subunit
MKKSLVFFALFTIFSLVIAPTLVSAQGNLNLGTEIVAESIDLGTQDIRTTIAKIINVAMGLLGIVAVVIILLGGFKWMTAGGNDENVKAAKKLIVSGIIGLVIIITAYAIAQFVLESLVEATTEGEVL